MNQEIQTALKEHLSGGTSMPIAWPNTYSDVTRPRLEVSFFHTPTERTQVSTGGGRYAGFMQVNVVWDLGEGTDLPNETAQDIADLFPADLVLPTTVGRVRITKQPSIQGGFSDSVAWRVPIDINFEVLSTT